MAKLNKLKKLISDASEHLPWDKEVRLIDPVSNGEMKLAIYPDGRVSTLELYVPDEFRKQGIGSSLQRAAIEEFPNMMGQVSSRTAAKSAYDLGRRPVDNPDASLEDVFKIIDEWSSVNMQKPQVPESASGLLGQIDTSYRGSHTPPDADYGAPLYDLTEMIPEDVYSSQGARLYGYGDPAVDREVFDTLRKARGNPDLEVPIYRAVPKGVTDINKGDWVTTSKEYARLHGENALNGQYDILESVAPAKKLQSEGYPYEFGLLPALGTVGTGVLGTLAATRSQDSMANPIADLRASEAQFGMTPQERAVSDLRASENQWQDTQTGQRIQAAEIPWMQDTANALRKVETPWGGFAGQPFESTANSLDRWAYGEKPDMMDKVGLLLELGTLGGAGYVRSGANKAKQSAAGILTALGF